MKESDNDDDDFDENDNKNKENKNNEKQEENMNVNIKNEENENKIENNIQNNINNENNENKNNEIIAKNEQNEENKHNDENNQNKQNQNNNIKENEQEEIHPKVQNQLQENNNINNIENNNNLLNNENNNNINNVNNNNNNNNENNNNVINNVNNNNNINNGNNHANQINRNEEDKKTISTIKSKIKELKEKYNFCIQFFDIMTKILNNIQELSYEKIKNSTNESLNYFKFFKNASDLYTKFAEDMKLSNNIIMSSANLPKMNDNMLLNVIKKTQDLLCKNLYNTSSSLNKNIISKGPMANLTEKINKIESIKKNNHSKFKEIEELKKKLIKNYKNSENLFEIFCPDINNRQNRRLPPLIDTPDFVCIVKQLVNLINKLTLDINLYMIEIKDSLYTINGIFAEINNLVRDSVLIYIKENKKVFNIDVTKNFEEIEKYYKKLEENQGDKMFKLKKIFDSSQSEQNFHTLLQQYYILLSSSNFIKPELLKDRNTFSIDKYDNIVLFFEWLITVSPQPTSLTIDELIIKKFKVKRDPGVFKSWKDSIMIFTKQYHLLIFDEPENSENLAKIFELDKTSFKKRNDNKRKFLFELIANRKGKLMNFTGNFLFDGLNNENINEIPPLVYLAYNH